MTQGGQPGSLLDLLRPWSASSFHLSHGPCTRGQDPMPSAPTFASAACGCSQEGFLLSRGFLSTHGWLAGQAQAPSTQNAFPQSPAPLGP